MEPGSRPGTLGPIRTMYLFLPLLAAVAFAAGSMVCGNAYRVRSTRGWFTFGLPVEGVVVGVVACGMFALRLEDGERVRRKYIVDTTVGRALLAEILPEGLPFSFVNTELTKKNFKTTVERQGITFVDFWATWCGPCRGFAPVFEKVAEAHPDVVFAKVNTDEEQEIAAHFQIRSIPTLMVFREKVILFQQAGALPASSLEQVLSQAKALDMAEGSPLIIADPAGSGRASDDASGSGIRSRRCARAGSPRIPTRPRSSPCRGCRGRPAPPGAASLAEAQAAAKDLFEFNEAIRELVVIEAEQLEEAQS